METSSELQQKTARLSPKEILKLVLKFALVGAIFWLLFRKGLVTSESIQKVISSPKLLAFNLFLIILNTLFSTYRWKLLLQCHQVYLTYWETLRYGLIGSFFNFALPGAVSGDVVKAVYIAAKFKEKRSSIFGSILFDRVLGVSALVIVGAVSAVISQFVNWGGELPNTLLYSVYLLGACVASFYAYLFISHKADPVLKVLKWMTKKHSKLGSLERIWVGIMHYRNHFSETFRALLLSLVIHFFVVTVAFMLASELSTNPLPFIALAVIVPIGMLATAIPVLPAGVGTGHAAFYFLFQLVGSAQGAEVFSWLVFLQVGISLFGGIVYLRTKLE